MAFEGFFLGTEIENIENLQGEQLLWRFSHTEFTSPNGSVCLGIAFWQLLAYIHD